MAQIWRRKHVRQCPLPRKPPIPNTAGPLHIKPWTIPDYIHRRRQFLLREPKRQVPEFAEYHGSKCTDITETQRQLVPLHALHPNLLNAPDPYYNRKVTSVTEYIAHRGKPRTGPVITTESVPYFGTKGTSVTEHLRYVPPAHPAGKDVLQAVNPFYGIQKTDATSCPKEEHLQRAEPTILSYMLPHRPKTAPTVVFPQHMSADVLVNAIAERRRMFLERPNSARMHDSRLPASMCDTSRSDAAVVHGDVLSGHPTAGDATNFEQTPRRSVTAGGDASKTSTEQTPRRPVTAGDVSKTGTEQTPRRPVTAGDASNTGTEQTPRRPVTAGDASQTSIEQTPRRPVTAGGDASKTSTEQTPRRPVTAGDACKIIQTPRRPVTGESPRSQVESASTARSEKGTPASVSTTPRSSRGKAACPTELLSRAVERLGPDKVQRITNWTGYFDDPKPKMAWRC